MFDNLKQIEPLVWAANHEYEWDLLASSGGSKINQVEALYKEEKAIKSVEEKIKGFHRWVKKMDRSQLTPNALLLLMDTSDEDQTAFFNELTSSAKHSDDLPNIVFATRRAPARCGLVIESRLAQLPENILSLDGNLPGIKILPHIGSSSEPYRDRVAAFLKDKFPQTLQYPFVRHAGTKTCFFACEPLGMLTHGYDADIVGPVVRRYIAKWFQLIDDGLDCMPQQRAFFKRYQRLYYKKGRDFFDFKAV